LEQSRGFWRIVSLVGIFAEPFRDFRQPVSARTPRPPLDANQSAPLQFSDGSNGRPPAEKTDRRNRIDARPGQAASGPPREVGVDAELREAQAKIVQRCVDPDGVAQRDHGPWRGIRGRRVLFNHQRRYVGLLH
jgi:hypothetical protein